MKVLHLTLSLARGGRRTAILSLIDALRRVGIESALCCIEELGCDKEELGEIGVPIEVLSRRSLFDGAALEKLRVFCRKIEPDILHTHDAASQATAALARLRMKRLPLLMTFHRSRSNESAKLGHRLRNALAATQCCAIITTSHERRDHFLEQNLVPASKVLRLPHGVELSRFDPDEQTRQAVRQQLGIASDVVLVGTIGHFGPEKGVDLAIRAFQSLAGSMLGKRVAMVIFGEGHRAAQLKELAASAPVPGPIIFGGYRHDIQRAVQSIDILLHAPRLEAFGLVLIEAMAAAVPVVAGRVGGIPEIVCHGSTGFLAESEKPETFTKPLLELIRDREFRNAMGQEGRRVALLEYGLDLYAQRHAQLYQDLLAGRQPEPILMPVREITSRLHG